MLAYFKLAVNRGAQAVRGVRVVKRRKTLIRRRARMKWFQFDEKRRTVTQIEFMIAEFERIAADLDQEIKIEQDRSGIHDPAHFAYSTYAKAVMQRRANLRRSAADLKLQLDDAKAAVAEEFDKMKKAELLDERHHMRERAEEEAREQAGLIGSAPLSPPNAAAPR
jgi:flagellar export protein FliJ